MTMELEAALSMMMAREASRRTQQLQDQRGQVGQSLAQQALQGVQQGLQQGLQQGVQPGGSAASALSGAMARNESVGRAWGGFQQAGATSAVHDAPISEAQRQAIYAADGATATAIASTAATSSTGRAVTNQDLINQYYRQGGGTWAGASKAARKDGRTLSELVKDRSAVALPASPGGMSVASGAASTSGGASTAVEASSSSQRASAGRMASGGSAVSGASRAASSAGSQAATATGGAVDVASTRGLSEAQKYDFYSQLAAHNGGQVKTGPNQKNIVGLRTPTDADTNGGNGRYDDRFVMFWKDSAGQKHVREYAGNTEPSARYRGRMGVDANGDGRRDQGRLPNGFYEFSPGHSSELGRVLRPVRECSVDRDTNQDGVFGNDRGAKTSGGSSMLFHAGGNSITGSAGCQTMRPEDFSRFWRDMQSGGTNGRIGYTLVTAA